MRIADPSSICVLLLALLLPRSCDSSDDYYVYVDGATVDTSAAWSSEYSVQGIDYWSDYSLKIQSCISYNDADVMVFSLYDQSNKQCHAKSQPIGTYYTTVPQFANAYFAQAADNAYHQGVNNYEAPSLAKYASCTEFVTDSGATYYAQLGCASSGVHSMAVNLYKDNTCTERISGKSIGIDASDISITFGSCATCVIWYDKTNQDIDDQYWQVHKNDAPLCSLLYQNKESCGGSCLSAAMSAAKAFVIVEPKTWTTSEKWGIALMFLFGGVLTYSILRLKYLVTKDELLQNAKSEQELKDPVVVDPSFRNKLIAVVSAIGFVSLILAFLKEIVATWIIMLGTLSVLFGYSLKLAMEAGKQPCGNGYGYSYESDDEDEDTTSNRNTLEAYTAPTVDVAKVADVPETKAEESGVVA